MGEIKPFQRTLAAGEIAPWLVTRGDTGKYAFACLLARNVQIGKWGAGFNRPGLEFVSEVADSSKATRLVPWIFDDDDRYALQLGNGTLRFHQQGSTVLAGTLTAHSTTAFYVPGDLVSKSGVNYYCIASNTNQAPPNATYWYAMPASGVLELPTPWTDSAFTSESRFTTRFVQSFDYVWWSNREVPVYVLKRFSNTDWTLQPETFLPNMMAPFGGSMSGTGSTGSSNTWRYKVVAVKKGDSPIESLPGDGADSIAGTLSGGTGSKIRITTATPHGVIVNDDVYVRLVYPIGQTPDPVAEAALEGTVFNVGAVGGGGTTMDLDGTTGITVASGYGVIITPTASAMYGTGFNGGTTGDLIALVSSHGLATGDEVYCLDVVGGVLVPAAPTIRAALKNHVFRVTVVDANSFALDGTAGLGPAPAALAIFGRAEIRTDVGDATLGTGNPIVLSWYAVADAAHYWIFKRNKAGAFGYIAQTDATTWTDDGTLTDVDIDDTDGPPQPLNPFTGAGNWPQACGLAGARLYFGGSDNDPSKFRASREDDLLNYTVHSPQQDNDAIGRTLGISDARDIRHFVSMDQLALFTGGRKIVLVGDGNGSITPELINAQPRGGLGGVSHVRPLVIDADCLFVEARQSIVRRFRLDLVEGQKAADLTAYAPHLFEGFTIIDWCWQAIPNPTVWIVRSDGKLVSMTYVPEQEIIACCRHDTGDGTDFGFESICCIPEDGEDRVYVVVRRTVNSSTKRYVERFARRQAGIDDYDLVEDGWFLDSAVAYDGRNTTSHTLTLTGGTTWAANEAGLTLTASAATFAGTGADVGKKYRLHSGTDTVDVEVTLQGSTTVCTVKLTTAAPASLRGVATAVWSLLATSMTGLSHLEGRTVALIGDGVRLVDKVVSSGAAVVSTASEVVVAGLSYLSQIKMLPPTSASPSGALEDASKVATKVRLDVKDTVSNRTQGLRVGTDEDGEMRPLNAEFADDTSTALLNGKIGADVGGEFKLDAGIFIEMADPLPMMVNGIIVDYDVEASPA